MKLGIKTLSFCNNIKQKINISSVKNAVVSPNTSSKPKGALDFYLYFYCTFPRKIAFYTG